MTACPSCPNQGHLPKSMATCRSEDVKATCQLLANCCQGHLPTAVKATCQLLANCCQGHLSSACQLPSSACQLLVKCLPTACQVPANCLSTAVKATCQLLANCCQGYLPT